MNKQCDIGEKQWKKVVGATVLKDMPFYMKAKVKLLSLWRPGEKFSQNIHNSSVELRDNRQVETAFWIFRSLIYETFFCATVNIWNV